MNVCNVSGKRVAILESTDASNLEIRINQFLDECGRPVWNIQYQCCGSSSSGGTRYSALIIYG